MTQASISARICENIAIKDHFRRLILEIDLKRYPEFAKILPGQFAEFDISPLSLPPIDKIPKELRDSCCRKILLPRPFSFAGFSIKKGNLMLAEVLFRIVGPGTLRMSSLTEGDTINLIGPLGKPFGIPASKKYALLVAGGMGIAPLLPVAELLGRDYEKVSVSAFIGAKTVDELPFELESGHFGKLTELGIEQKIATDDGSAGFSGFVTNCLQNWLDKKNLPADETVIYGCGPEPMLAVLAKIAQKYGIGCQISMEKMMACGIGLCQGCAVKTKTDGKNVENTENEPKYQLCCKDGPVFDSKEVIFE